MWQLLWISPFDRKDDPELRFWLEKPAIDWMQHIDTDRGKDYFMGCMWFFYLPPLPPTLSGFRITENIPRNGRTGVRCSGAPSVGAGRPGAPSRLSDRSFGPRLRAARRSLPAGEVLPLTHTDGSTLRSVNSSCFSLIKLTETFLLCCFFNAQNVNRHASYSFL